MPTPMTEYKGVPGWFDFEPFYRFIVNQLPKNPTVVECGVLFGASATCLVDLIEEKGLGDVLNPCAVHLLDQFDTDKLGEPGRSHCKQMKMSHFETFMAYGARNKLLFRPSVVVIVEKNDSLNAGKLFQPRSLDFVFIDTEHTREQLTAEIKVFKPLMKKGGILAGHDYSKSYPGVAQAVHHHFGPHVTLFEPSSWFVRI